MLVTTESMERGFETSGEWLATNHSPLKGYTVPEFYDFLRGLVGVLRIRHLGLSEQRRRQEGSPTK